MIDIILNLLIMSGIGALLALLLEIANKYMADYGQVELTLNEERRMTVDGGSPLLFTLMDQGIFIPSACGGRGTCAYCKVKITEGGGPVLPTELPYLDKKEIEDAVRLSCQVKVRNDLKIVIPEELFLIKEFLVKVGKIEQLTPAIKGVNLKIKSPEDGIVFKPGQYVQLEVPAFELLKEPDFRAFSICSSCSKSDEVDLYITRAPEGEVSLYIHDYLKEGEELVMRGPFGDFYYREASDRDILFIATGSGLAPIRSILHHMEENNIERKTTLFFGARKPGDLYEYDTLKSLEKKLPSFKYVPVLSRVSAENGWDGEQGRVTDLIDKYVPDNAAVDAYICGNPDMVDSCQKLLEKKGVPSDRIYFDKFA